MRKRTHYETLGLTQDASLAQVKSQYRRMAKRYHPDLNQGDKKAAQQFLEVQAAYEILVDPEKRRHYDHSIGYYKPQEQTSTRQQRRYTYDYDWRPPRPRSRTYNRPVSRPHQPRAAYTHYTVEVSLQELFKGARRSLTIGQTFTCGRCRGTGKYENQLTCERCGGYGFVVSYRVVEVIIPPGLVPDMSIHLAVNDDQPEHPLLDTPVMTNISVTIKLSDSTPYEYRDHQLHTSTRVPADLLEQGGQWTIPAPEGGELTFKIPEETPSGSILTLRKHGLRNGASSRRGNLFCTVLAEEAAS
ncbi:MAG TPA: DnaJ domain-containing protein [Chloroflexia bacterium]|nr:DnaJ domain-containing protein [Chloroflexia bacterium]